jgi:hypothetical protein
MIERQYGEYYAVCDICDETIGPCDSWGEAKEQMKQDGWQFFLDGHKEWQHLCPKCRNLK